MNILDEIIAYKREEVRRKRQSVGLKELEASTLFDRTAISLKEFLGNPAKTGIIAEFKRKSPSKGWINEEAEVNDVTAAYTRHGASGISILTDGHFFGGNNEDLMKARDNHIPLLRKEFIIDEYQVAEAKSIGADAILLIAACLSPMEVERLAKHAKLLGLEVLLELHDESELGHICSETELIGVNNRNLKTFEVDIDNALKLAEQIPVGKIRIAESGIRNPEDVLLFKRNGFDGFLIGESFMKTENPGWAFEQFVNILKQKINEH